MRSRKKVVKILAFLMIAVLALGVFAGCSSKTSVDTKTDAATGQKPADTAQSTAPKANTMPIVKEKTTLNFMGMNMNTTRVGRLDESDMMKKVEETTNVKVVWDLIPQASWKEKKNLVIASRQLPDVFMGPMSFSSNEIAKYGADGVFIPLDKLIKDFAPRIVSVMKEYPDYEGFVKSMDGKIYALANITDLGFDSHSSAIIRKEWMDKLNLKMPTTLDEFYQVLNEFKVKDPAGGGKTIPFSFLYQEGPDINREVKREHEWIFAAFGVAENPRHVAIQDDGQVIFTSDKPAYKEAIKYMNKLYSQGLIDKEVFTQDRTLLTNKVRQMNVGAYTDYRLKTSIASEEIQDKFAVIPALKGPSGKQMWLRCYPAFAEGAYEITSACKNPEIAIRWADYINEPEIGIQMAYGMFREEGFNKSEAQIPSKTQPGKYDVNTTLRPKEVQPSDWPMSAPIAVAYTMNTKAMIEKYTADKPSNVAKQEVCAVYRSALTKYPYNYPYKFSVDELEELNLIQTDLHAYIFKTQAKWIADGGIDAEWDNYLAQLKKLKADKYLEFYKKSFERAEKK